MAKQRTDLDTEVEIATSGWISVDRKIDPQAWEAWRYWRRIALGSLIEPKAFTVPSKFPPMTHIAVSQYIEAVRLIRRSGGWNDDRAQIPEHPEPWDGCVPPAPAERQERMVTPEFVRAFYKRNGLRILPEAAE
jgi:hypothetical protein